MAKTPSICCEYSAQSWAYYEDLKAMYCDDCEDLIESDAFGLWFTTGRGKPVKPQVHPAPEVKKSSWERLREDPYGKAER